MSTCGDAGGRKHEDDPFTLLTCDAATHRVWTGETSGKSRRVHDRRVASRVPPDTPVSRSTAKRAAPEPSAVHPGCISVREPPPASPHGEDRVAGGTTAAERPRGAPDRSPTPLAGGVLCAPLLACPVEGSSGGPSSAGDDLDSQLSAHLGVHAHGDGVLAG